MAFRLLIIDDDRDFGEFIARVAASCGFEVAVTTSPEEFRSHVESFSPHVIALDLHMPGTDGVELLAELGDQGCAARLILMSGFDERTLRIVQRSAEEMGLDVAAALDKPIRAAKLKAELNQLNLRAALDADALQVERNRSNLQDTVDADALREAMQQDQFFLAYQPKIDMSSNLVVGIEALLRWRRPSGEIVYPDRFIELAEREGVIGEITRWVLTAATEQAQTWRRHGLDLTMSVNVSAKDVNDVSLPDWLERRCRSLDLPTQSLVCELTETAAAQNAAQLVRVLTRFRLKGLRLAMDDFGTGYSSLVQLLRLPFSELKIDKSFVARMDRDSDSRTVAKAVVDLGHNLGMSVTAEGVENAQILELLKQYGCDAAQGFYLARPCGPDEILDMVDRARDGSV